MNTKKEESLNLYPKAIDSEKTEKILEQMKKCICKICLENGIKGTGIFSKINFPNKENLLPVLITNNHVINILF